MKSALKSLLAAFALAGLFALSCPHCGGEVHADEPTIQLTRAKWSQVMKVLVNRRTQIAKLQAERDSLRKQLVAERNAGAKKLLAERAICARRKKCPSCDGWKMAVGVCVGVVLSAGVVIGVMKAEK